LIDVVLRRPVVNAGLVAGELGLSAPNAYRPIKQLVADGILVEFTDKRRDRAWRAPGVLQILDDFAAGARRRRLLP
jgi:Fic family protein